MNITERLFKIMKEKKITQNQLAELLNTRQATISAWKQRGTTPPMEYLPDICKALNISWYYLITGEEQEAEILTKDERNLISCYRAVNETGQRRIMEYAAEMEKIHPRANENVKIG